MTTATIKKTKWVPGTPLFSRIFDAKEIESISNDIESMGYEYTDPDETVSNLVINDAMHAGDLCEDDGAGGEYYCCLCWVISGSLMFGSQKMIFDYTRPENGSTGYINFEGEL